MKDKPHKWGIKIFLLASKDAYILNSLIYQGATSNSNNKGLTSYVV